MAKKTKSISFKNATLCLADSTIVETTKDETRVYSLDRLLKEWDGIEGITLSLRMDTDADEDGE